MAAATVTGNEVEPVAGEVTGLGGGASTMSHQNTNYTANRVESPISAAHTRWGERSASAEYDFNGDQKNDVWVATPAEDGTIGGTTLTNAGRVRLMSGASLAGGSPVVLRTITSPVPQGDAKFGSFISVIGDVNGDAKADIAVGTDSQDVGSNTDQGKAWVFNGDTTAPIYALDNPVSQSGSRFGSRIGRAGDLNGDGKSEVIVGDSAYDNGAMRDQGRAYIFNGATGALFRTLEMPDVDPNSCTSCGTFGSSVQGPGDTDGDGIPDQLVGASGWNSGRGRLYLFSGATGALIPLSGNGGIGHGRINSPVPEVGANFGGFQDVAPKAPGDVTGDNKNDIYGNGFSTDGAYTDQGRAWLFNGATGAVLCELVDPSPQVGGGFGSSMATTDYDGLSPKDLYVGGAPKHSGSTGIGGMAIFRGSDGTLLKALDMPFLNDFEEQVSLPGNLGPNLGWSVAAAGDLNDDGQEDYIAGAPFTDVGGRQDQGRLYVYVSGP